MNARYYDPHLCSFIMPDPAMDGLNHYAYCSANPIRYTDPTGLDYFDPDNWGEGTAGAQPAATPTVETSVFDVEDASLGAAMTELAAAANNGGSDDDSSLNLSILFDPINMLNNIDNPFKNDSSINFSYNWTLENGKDQLNQILDSTWDGDQKLLSPITGKENALCLVSEMLWDCLKELNAKITVKEAKDIIYALEKEGSIYTSGGKLGWMKDNSSVIQNKMWNSDVLKSKPGWVDGTWVHSNDSTLKSMIGNHNYGYVKSPSKEKGGLYSDVHWLSVKELNYGQKSVFGLSFIKINELTSVVAFDSFSAKNITVNISQISTKDEDRISATFIHK